MTQTDLQTGSFQDHGYAGMRCGYRPRNDDGSYPPHCRQPAVYAFWLKGWPNCGLSCAEHALIVRGFTALEKVWSL